MTFRGVVYTEAQIDAYLARIKFPSGVEKPIADNVTTKYGLEYLKRLQKYHMQACAFEKYAYDLEMDVLCGVNADCPKPKYALYAGRD